VADLTAALAEASRRTAHLAIYDSMHADQRHVADLIDRRQFSSIVTPRRWGKTYSAAGVLTRGCLRGYRCLYMAPTVDQGHETLVGNELLPMLDRFKIPHEVRKTPSLSIQIGDGKLLIGTTAPSFIDRRRGDKYYRIVIDETQDIASDVLHRLIYSSLSASMADADGHIALYGTPGPVCSGLYHASSTGQRADWAGYTGRPFANPVTADGLRKLTEVFRLEFPNVEDLPWYRREYFGEWVPDSRNAVVSLRADSLVDGDYQSLDGDQVICGVHYGEHSDSAYSIAICNPRQHGELHYIGSLEFPSTVGAHRYVSDTIMSKHPHVTFYSSQSPHAEDMAAGIRARYGTPIVIHDKRDDAADIALLRSDVGNGAVVLHDRRLHKQWSELVWIDESGKRDLSQPNAIHHAAVAAWRASQHAYYVPPMRKKTLEEKMLDKVIQQRKRRSYR
jgi:hypothetical protein